MRGFSRSNRSLARPLLFFELMNTLLLVVVLAGVQSEELTPPPLPPPVEAPAPRREMRLVEDAPVERPQNGGRIAGGVSLLAVGYVASIVNTSVYWFTDGVRQWSFFGLIGLPLGIIISAVPIVGPLVGLIADLASQQTNQASYPIRTIVNVVSLAMQISGFVLLVTMPRAPKQPKKDIFAVTGFGASPIENGAMVGLGGRFDFPY